MYSKKLPCQDAESSSAPLFLYNCCLMPYPLLDRASFFCFAVCSVPARLCAVSGLDCVVVPSLDCAMSSLDCAMSSLYCAMSSLDCACSACRGVEDTVQDGQTETLWPLNPPTKMTQAMMTSRMIMARMRMLIKHKNAITLCGEIDLHNFFHLKKSLKNICTNPKKTYKKQ